MTGNDGAASRIMVALDQPSAEAAERIVQQLKGIPCWMKVGMQLYYAAGPDFVRKLKDVGYRVFLDLKMHDIPNTVKGGANSIAGLGVDMFNVHAAGGMKMMSAALEGVEEAVAAGKAPYREGRRPIVIAVTQLTSTSQAMLNAEIGIPGAVEDTVLRYAELAKEAGLHGVVASPLEAAAIKQSLGADFIAVTPGIRPSGAAAGDQTRIMTPAEAFQQGADYIVIGRPITGDKDPRRALETIVEELS